jgi:hypothetical protein
MCDVIVSDGRFKVQWKMKGIGRRRLWLFISAPVRNSRVGLLPEVNDFRDTASVIALCLPSSSALVGHTH